MRGLIAVKPFIWKVSVYHVSIMKSIIFWTVAVLLVLVSRFDRLDWMSMLAGASVTALAFAWAMKFFVKKVMHLEREQRRMAAKRP